jgi:hypothetical protein
MLGSLVFGQQWRSEEGGGGINQSKEICISSVMIKCNIFIYILIMSIF